MTATGALAPLRASRASDTLPRRAAAAGRRLAAFGPWTFVLLGAAVFALAGVAVWHAGGPTRIATWWPAAGVAVVAAAWAPGRRVWGVGATVLLAGTAANVLLGGRPLALALGLALGGALEAVAAGRFLRRGRDTPQMRTVEDVVRLALAAVLGACVMGGVAALAGGVTGYADPFATARTVMTSHAAALMVIVPLGMVVLRPRAERRPVERLAQWVLLPTVAWAVFTGGQSVPLTFLPVPVLVWCALRNPPRVVAAQLLTVAVVVTTASGTYVADAAGGHGAQLVQAYLVTLALVALPLSVSVTLRRVTFEGVSASERLFRGGFSDSLVGMVVMRRCTRQADDPGGGLAVVEANPVAARLLGRAESELVGSCWTDHLDPADRTALADAAAAMLAGTVPGWRGEVALRTDHGTRWLELAVSPLTAEPGLLVGQMVDVTGRREAEERLTAQALTDALTGLGNRTLLRDRIGLALDTLPAGAGVAVLFCDLDDFKNVNDSAGHTVGDAVLVEIARRLEALLRPGDLAARQGGDEFVLLRPAVVATDEAEDLGRRVIETVTRPVVVDGGSYAVGVSVGIVWSGGGASADDLLRDADAAMYAAKAAGKRRAVVYTSEHRRRAVRAVTVETELRGALADGDLDVHLQPVVDLATGRVLAAEALVRWQHPQRGLLPPGEWLDVAEDRGLMPAVGELVLRRACALAAAWPGGDDAGPAAAVHVNVSARQLDQSDFVATVLAALDASGLAPGRLVLEFTETHLDQVSDALLADLMTLRDAGVGMAADDFGTGYSPLTRITELPLSMIKIDRRFVAGMLEDPRASAVVTTLVRLGHSLGLDVVAEGVETAEGAGALRALGCPAGQGYWWSRPVTPSALATLLEAGPLAVPDVPARFRPRASV